MPLYWLCYRLNNQISVAIEPSASLIHARMRAELDRKWRVPKEMIGRWPNSNECTGLWQPTPALHAATALTRPNRPAQRLPCGCHAVPTAQTIGPNDVLDCAKRQDLGNPSLLTRARAQATVRVWKKRPELQAHSRIRLGSEVPAGFRSRRGRCRESTPVIPQYAPFASYKVASYTWISEEVERLKCQLGFRLPNKPSVSPFGPAVK